MQSPNTSKLTTLKHSQTSRAEGGRGGFNGKQLKNEMRNMNKELIKSKNLGGPVGEGGSMGRHLKKG